MQLTYVAGKSKRNALKEVYRAHRSAGRAVAYDGYRQRTGRTLDDFATWCVLAEKHGDDWRDWPAEFQHPDHPAVRAFAEKHSSRVDFHRWLQWQLDDQLTAGDRPFENLIVVDDRMHHRNLRLHVIA